MIFLAKVGSELALISAGTPEKFNSMTIMFGAIGMIWSKKAYFAFIKPERYTFDFIKDSEYFTVSYFPKEFNKIHKIFGYKSGREIDKIQETGITPEFIDNGITFTEANEIYICKKIYFKQMDKDFEPEDVVAQYNDPKNIIFGECHYALIGEIEKHIVR